MSTTASAMRQDRVSNRWAVLGLLVIGIIIAYVDRSNLSVALTTPEFKHFFRLTDLDRGTLNSAFFWSYAFLQIPAGWLVDRYGVKRPYFLGFLLWSAVSMATAFTSTVAQVCAVRFVLGIGESVAIPASMRWIRFHFPERHRGVAVGMLMAGAKIGPALGPPLATWLIQGYDWRIMFIALGAGGLLWLLPWVFMVRNDDRQMEREVTSAAPQVGFGEILASPVIWGTVTGTFCYMYFVYFCMTWMPAYFVEHRHLKLEQMAAYSFFSFAGMAVVATLGGWAADRLIAAGRNPVRVRKAFTIAGFVMASTEMLGAITDSVPMALFFAVFSLSGLGLATANYWALTQTLIPGGAIGRIVGIQNCAASLPGIVAPVLTGWLIKRTGSYTAPMQAIWFFLLLGIAAYLFLVREKYAPARRSS